MFKVGQKVVCVNNTPNPNTQQYMPMRLVVGEIYTIRAIKTEPHIEGYGVQLVELINPSFIWADGSESEWAYHPNKFRPLVENNDALKASLIA